MGEMDTTQSLLSTSIPLLLQAGEDGRREYGVSFISAGRVRSRDGKEALWEIPADTIKAALDKMNAKAVFVDHGTWLDDYPHMDRLAAVSFDAKWNEGTQSADGGIRVYNTPIGQTVMALFDNIIQDQQAGKEVPDVGLSLTFFGKHDLLEMDGGEHLRVTKEITHIESIDIVFGPGTKNARIREILSSFGGKQMEPEEKEEGEATVVDLNPFRDPFKPVSWRLIGPSGQTIEVPADQLATIPAAQNTPEVQMTVLNNRLSGMEATINRLAQTLDAGAVMGNGKPVNDPPRATNGLAPIDKIALGYERLMGLKVDRSKAYPFMGLKDLYIKLTGDYAMSGIFNPEQAALTFTHEELSAYLLAHNDIMPWRLAYNPSGNNADTTTMAELTRNVMNKVMIDQINYLERYMWWERIVKMEDFESLQQISWVRLGGIGDIPTVAEKAEYTQLAWDDARTTADWVKKGGYLPLSLEMIDRDDLAGWRTAPRQLVKAAVVTLSGVVSALFTDNAGIGPEITTEGSTANLFSSTWGNLITQPLDATNWSLAVQTMYSLAEFNVSGRRQGVRPRYGLGPIELETQGIRSAAQSNEPGSFNDIRPRASLIPPENWITVPHWTDAESWAAVADPQEVPIAGVGFRFGRNPELFTEPSNTGLMFFNDVMPIKVRWFFAVSAIDPRGAIKSNV